MSGEFDTSKFNLPSKNKEDLPEHLQAYGNSEIPDQPINGGILDNKPKKVSPIPNASRGRPLGSTNISSRRAVKKLEELGFDPIAKMVELYDNLTLRIYEMTHDEHGNPTTKFSQMAHANLCSAQQKCISELMRYGYARVTENVELSTKSIAPLTIQLTDSTDTFTPAPPESDDDQGAFRGDDE